MRLEPDPNFALLRMAGKGDIKRLVLTDREKATLKAAQEICRKAADALGEEDDGDFRSAEWHLDIARNGF